MAGFLEQLPALIGVSIGAAGTYVATSLAERTRWRRGQTTRWDERRVDSYTAYADVVKRMIYTAMQVAAGRGADLDAHPMPLDEGLLDLRFLERERSLRWEALLLLAGSATGESARVWHRYVWRLEQLACARQFDIEQWHRTMAGAVAARERFYNEARRELSIQGHTLAGEQPPWTPRHTEHPQLPSPAPHAVTS
ncbi:hypothetical protein [Longispora urticae]